MPADTTEYFLLGLPQPGPAATLLEQGAEHHQARRLHEAMDCYQQAAGLEPDRYEPLVNIAGVRLHLGELDRAATGLEDVWGRAPHDLRVASNLALVHSKRKDWPGCARIMHAIRDRPGHNATWVEMNLGTCYMAMLEPARARTHFEAALAIDPTNGVAHEKLIYLSDFETTTTAEAALALRRGWYERFGSKGVARQRPHTNTRDPDRVLKIGYVSADWYAHSAMYCFGPVIRRHSPAVEVYVYSSMVDPEDPYTESMKRVVPRWRHLPTLTDEQMAERIRHDEIDILVDLSGFTTGGRLGVFCQKPAPVQVTAWGYATGLGIPEIDYFFADPIVVPDRLRHAYAEQVIHLPSIVPYEAPWVPPFDFAPEVSPIVPSQAIGKVVFGSLNRAEKLNDAVVETWARVLHAVPDSLLLLKSHQLMLPAVQDRVRAWFAQWGVAGDRIEILGTSPHPDNMLMYTHVDVALDPFPHTGGVTALEALYMGVPVVTMIGDRTVNRLSPSFLTQLGRTDWIAFSPEEYVSIAVALAKDVDGRAQVRRTMRDHMHAAPLGRLEAYTQAVEDAYRVMWRRWCLS